MADYDLKRLLPLLGFILFLVLFGLVRRYLRKRKISSFVTGEDSLANWKYTAEEWREYTDMEFFDSIRRKDVPGEAYITPKAVFVTNGYDKFFRDLTETGKIVTHCTYSGKSPGVLKIRVRWKEQINDSVEYYYDECRIPVPNSSEAQANRVAQYFNEQAEMRKGEIQALMPDGSFSIFGDDKI